MVDLLADDLSETQRSQLMHGAVVPRPIAWISSQRGNGPVNLAPFSCYTYICGTPPLIVIAVGTREGRLKDTLQNVISSGEFVINSVTPDVLAQAAQSSWDYPTDAGEAAELGVDLEPSIRVKVPRVARAALSLECALDRLIEIGDIAAHRLMIGRVLCFRIRDDMFCDGRIDVNRFLPRGSRRTTLCAPTNCGERAGAVRWSCAGAFVVSGWRRSVEAGRKRCNAFDFRKGC